jgi:osmotically-inducible protein OsmY
MRHWRRTGNLSSRQPVAGVDPAALAAQTSTLLANDPLVATSGIRVDADDTGRVVLHGKVPNQSIAAQAVHDAMKTPAVLAVESRLEW